MMSLAGIGLAGVCLTDYDTPLRFSSLIQSSNLPEAGQWIAQPDIPATWLS